MLPVFVHFPFATNLLGSFQDSNRLSQLSCLRDLLAGFLDMDPIQPGVVFAFLVSVALVPTCMGREEVGPTALIEVDQQVATLVPEGEGDLVGLQGSQVLISFGLGSRVVAVVVSSHGTKYFSK